MSAPIIFSGTKAKLLPSGLVAAGALTTNSTGIVSATNGTSGHVLTSNGAGVEPTFQVAAVQVPLAPLSVTSAELAAGSVTKPKLAALGQIFSSDVSFTSNSGSFVDITNATVTIVTTGRPVFVAFVPDTTGSCLVQISQKSSSLFHAVADIKILRDVSTTVFQTAMGYTTTRGDSDENIRYPGCLFLIDVPAAGSHDYKMQLSAGNSDNTTVTGRLMAYEI